MSDGGTHAGSITSTSINSYMTTVLNNFLGAGGTQNNNYVNTRPKAFLNWMVVDEEFQAVGSTNHLGASQVPLITSGTPRQPIFGPSNMVIRRNGYLYIYVSNEANQNVYFDSLVINHKRGPLLEQRDYYPFGYEIPGLATLAFKSVYDQNRYRYNGIEYDTAFSLDYNEAYYRDLDPVVGRFIQADPKSENLQEWSPYQSNFDNPVRFADPKGDCPQCIIGLIVGLAVDYGIQVAKNLSDGQSLGTALTNINGQELAVSGASGFLTGGVSTMYNVAAQIGTKFAVSETFAQGTVAATNSLLNQANQNSQEGTPMNISIPRIAFDVATDNFASRVGSSVPTASTKTAENQLDRATRVASADPPSSGRAANLANAQTKVENIKEANFAKQNLVSSAISTTISKASDAKYKPIGDFQKPIPINDATYVEHPYIRQLKKQ